MSHEFVVHCPHCGAHLSGPLEIMRVDKAKAYLRVLFQNADVYHECAEPQDRRSE